MIVYDLMLAIMFQYVDFRFYLLSCGNISISDNIIAQFHIKGKICNKKKLQVFEERRNLLGKWVRHELTVKKKKQYLHFLVFDICSVDIAMPNPSSLCPSLRSGQIASGNRCYKIFSPDVLLTSWNISDRRCAAGYQRKPLTSLESFPGSYPCIYFHS